MTCLRPGCAKPAILLGLCVAHHQLPRPKRRISKKRKAAIEAQAEKFVAAADPPPGIWPGAHYAMGRALRKHGICRYLRDWILARGTFPDGVHEVLWNRGDDCLEIDFTLLRNDPDLWSKSVNMSRRQPLCI